MAVAAAAGGGYAYLPARLGSIQRIAVSGLVGPNGPGQVFLIAGSNSRAGESAAAARHFGSAAQVAALGPDTVLSGPAGRDASRR